MYSSICGCLQMGYIDPFGFCKFTTVKPIISY